MKKNQNIFPYMRAIGLILCCFACLTCISQYKNVKAKADPINSAKKGIIEIYSGFEDDAGNFHKMKNSSGFVVASSDERSYVITNYDTVKNSKREKAAFCKKHKISYTNGNLPDIIQVVLKGDVTADASILTESKLQDYSILEISNSLSEKTPLIMGNSEELVTGERIYTLGFSENAGEDDKGKNRHTEFSALDVEIYEGTIQDIQANQLGILHIQHSAKITKGNTGGPLIDEDGYVVGLNNTALNKNDESIFYSLPMEEIKTILNNYKVDYNSKDKLHTMATLKKEITECQRLLDDKSYKQNSKEELNVALTDAKALLTEETVSEARMNHATNELQQTKLLLEQKMKTMRKVMYALAIVIALMAVWLIKLVVENHIRKKGNDDECGDEAFVNEQTAVLSDRNKERELLKHQIRCVRTGDLMVIDKAEFYIGKKNELADFVISDNPVLSRQHAMIYRDKDSFYLKDCNSANGTFVNGVKLVENQRVPLKNGDTIVLANEKFIYQIMSKDDYQSP